MRRDDIYLPELGTTADERARSIDEKKSLRGGWTARTLKEWGVDWPPPAGWRRALVRGERPPEREEHGAH